MTLRVMPSGQQLFDNASAVQNPVVTAGTETLVLASAVAKVDQTANAVVFNGVLYVIPGANCTGLIVRLREGFGLSGAIDWEPVGFGPPAGISVTPGVANAVHLSGVVNAAYQQAVAGGQYSLTVQQAGAGGALGNAKVIGANLSFWQATWWDTEPS